MDLIDALDATFRHAHQVIAGVRPDQYDNPTPCEEWVVRDLLTHMIGVVAGMGAAAAAGAHAPAAKFQLAAEPAVQFETLAATTLEAWRTPGVMERLIDAGPGPMPARMLASINLIDTATHTWDLATATGQPAALPADVAKATLEVSLETIDPQLRPGRFGPERDPGPDADATERLVAFLGRQS